MALSIYTTETYLAYMYVSKSIMVALTPASSLTYLYRMNFPILKNKTSPFPI